MAALKETVQAKTAVPTSQVYVSNYQYTIDQSDCSIEGSLVAILLFPHCRALVLD